MPQAGVEIAVGAEAQTVAARAEVLGTRADKAQRALRIGQAEQLGWTTSYRFTLLHRHQFAQLGAACLRLPNRELMPLMIICCRRASAR
jgi:hypothetical protein